MIQRDGLESFFFKRHFVSWNEVVPIDCRSYDDKAAELSKQLIREKEKEDVVLKSKVYKWTVNDDTDHLENLANRAKKNLFSKVSFNMIAPNNLKTELGSLYDDEMHLRMSDELAARLDHQWGDQVWYGMV